MSDNKQVSSLDDSTQDFEKFKDWWNSLQPKYETPEIIFKHFETYFKPQWQSQQTNDGWVSVEEKNILPEYDEYVLWHTKDGIYFVECLDKDGNDWLYEHEVEGFKMYGVTHWHYLPKAPILAVSQQPITLGSKEPSSEDIAWAKEKIAKYESQQTKPGLRWVKASERLPAQIFGKIARFIHTKTILYDFIEWVRNHPDKLNLVEWLDESGETEETKPVEDKETQLEPIQNALYATGKFTTDECTELANGILMYINESPTPKPVSEEGWKAGKLDHNKSIFHLGQCQFCYGNKIL